MADDSDGEGDPSEDASDGDDSCGHPSVVEDDDDSNCEGMCFEDDSDHEDLRVSARDGDDDGESEEALPDVDGAEGEELGDEEGSGDEFVDDPCDEEGDGEAEDLCDDRSINAGEERGRDVFCASGFSTADGSRISDSVQDDSSSSSSYSSSSSSSSYYSSSEEEEEDDAAGFNWASEGFTPILLPWTVQMLTGAAHADSDNDADYDSDDIYYDDGEYELHRLPASCAVVESLPEVTLSEEEAAWGCAVCTDVFAPGERVVSLPCKHYFHGDCIRPWLAIRSTCPVCRYQLPTDDADPRHRQEGELMVLL